MRDTLLRNLSLRSKPYSLCLFFVIAIWGVFSIQNLVHFSGRSKVQLDTISAVVHQRSLIPFTSLLRDMIQRAAPDGDVFVKFDGPELRNEIGLFIYYYWSYWIYPRRLLVSDESSIIKNVDTFRRSLFAPDDVWLAQHGIERVITLSSDPDGNLNLRARDLRKDRP